MFRVERPLEGGLFPVWGRALLVPHVKPLDQSVAGDLPECPLHRLAPDGPLGLEVLHVPLKELRPCLSHRRAPFIVPACLRHRHEGLRTNRAYA